MTTLTQTRGDTVSYRFQRKTTAEDIIYTRPEAIFFTVKNTFNTAEICIQKSINQMTMNNDGTWRFTIEHSDTAEMPYGVYVFDLQITDNGAVTTVAKGQFKLTQEATWKTI